MIGRYYTANLIFATLFSINFAKAKIQTVSNVCAECVFLIVFLTYISSYFTKPFEENER